MPVQDDGTDGTPDHDCEGGPCLGDYPHIGADAIGFYITTNEYPFFADGFHAAQIYAFNKFALARNAATVNVTQIDTIGAVAGNPGFTAVTGASPPAIRYELAQDGTEYFLSSTAAEEANGSGTDQPHRHLVADQHGDAAHLQPAAGAAQRHSSTSAPTASRPRPTRSPVTSRSASASTTPPWRRRSGRAAGSCCSPRNPRTTR